MDDQEENHNHDDILTKFSIFVDDNLRVFRSLSWVLAGAGILLILRRTYVKTVIAGLEVMSLKVELGKLIGGFTQFKAVSEVPTEFVAKNISLHGHVREVRQDNSLGICHIPLLRGFGNALYPSSDTGMSPQSNLLTVSLPGVEFREGGHKWLKDNAMLAKVCMTPLQVTEHNTLDCILYKKKGWFSSMCVNEELVRQGVAVTCHVSTLANNTPYLKLQTRLLKAELRAEKKGVGIWVKPSLLERLQEVLSLPAVKMKEAASAVRRSVSFGRLFSRKTTKDDEK